MPKKTLKQSKGETCMKAVNLYILTRNTNSKLYSDYESVLSERVESYRAKPDEFQSLNALVEELLDNHVDINEMDGFYYSFSIQQIGKEFDLLRISREYMVLNIELKSRMVSEEEIEKQLLRNQYYLNHLAPEIVMFTYIAETNVFYQLKNGKIRKSTSCDVVSALRKMRDYETGDINQLFRARDFLISPLNTPEKFIQGQYFLTQQQETIKQEIITCVENKKQNKLWGITGSAGTGKTLLLYDLAKALSAYGRCCVVHSGMLCRGHYAINDGIRNLEVISAKSVEEDFLSGYRFILVDEAQRIYKGNLKVILDFAKQNGTVCIFFL